MKKSVLVMAAVLLLALPTVVLLEQIADALLAQLLLLVSMSVVLMLVGVAFRPEKDLPLVCDPFALQCVFLSQFFIVGPIASVAFGFGLSHLIFARPVQAQTALTVMLGFCLMLTMMIVGSQQRLGVILARSLPDFGPSRRKLPGIWIETIIVLIGLAGSYGWVSHQGGLMERLSRSYGDMARGGAIFLLFQNGLVTGTLLMFWRVIHSKTRTTATLVLFGSLMAFNLLYYGIIFGVRKYLIYLFFGFLAMFLLRRGQYAVSKIKIVACVVALLAFFSIWGTLRTRSVMELVGAASGGPREAALQSGNVAYFQSVADPFSTVCMIWEIFPDTEPYRHGRTLLVTLLGFIPRKMWPDKPVGLGKEITVYFVGPFFDPTEGLSLAPTMLGDFYVNFGWAGILVGGLLMGIACRAMAHYALEGMRDGKQYRPARVLLPALFLMGLGEVRGDMSSMLAFWAMTVLPMLFALAFFSFEYGHAGDAVAVADRPPVDGSEAGVEYPELGPALGGGGASAGPAGPAIR